jgi:hypothetical protein
VSVVPVAELKTWDTWTAKVRMDGVEIRLDFVAPDHKTAKRTAYSMVDAWLKTVRSGGHSRPCELVLLEVIAPDYSVWDAEKQEFVYGIEAVEYRINHPSRYGD